MNYEELANANALKATGKNGLHIGSITKKEVNGKYVNIIKVRQDLETDPLFMRALATECEANASLSDSHQLHFKQSDDSPMTLEIEQSQLLSIEKIVTEQPSMLSDRKFIDNILNGLLDLADYLHSQGIYHECFAPSSVFVRKGDSTPLVFSHGSYYTPTVNVETLYKDLEEYVAPEVMRGGTVDERCDIYSIGKLMEYIFSMAAMPIEYSSFIKKATNELPEDRQQSTDSIRKAMTRRRSLKQSLRTTIVVCVLAALCVGAYFYFMPAANTVEYVKPAAKQEVEDFLDDGFNPEEYGEIADTAVLTPEKMEQIRMYQAKSESIFRKRFEIEAEKILSKVYNKSYMNATEKQFMINSNSMIEELGKKQIEIANAADLDGTRSNAIASEIIEKITERRKADLKGGYGVQK